MIRVETSDRYSRRASLHRTQRLRQSKQHRQTIVQRRRKNRRAPVRILRTLGLVGLGIVLGACGVGHPGLSASRPLPAQHPVAAGNGSSLISTGRANQAAQEALPTSTSRWIVVQPGDTIWLLAMHYGDPNRPVGETVEDILRWNGLSDNARLQPGQHLRVSR